MAIHDAIEPTGRRSRCVDSREEVARRRVDLPFLAARARALPWHRRALDATGDRTRGEERWLRAGAHAFGGFGVTQSVIVPSTTTVPSLRCARTATSTSGPRVHASGSTVAMATMSSVALAT